jgi:hypothetical protein
MDVEEEECIGGFLERLEKGPTVTTDYARNTQLYPPKTFSKSFKARNAAALASATAVTNSKKSSKGAAGGGTGGSSTAVTSGGGDLAAHPNPYHNRKRTQWAARPGEQVAAKVTRTDENGSWILASVQRFYPDTETYDVQDEDDTSKLIRLPWSHVMRLSTGGEGCFTKGADCMAIFPETTSFYKAKVAKSPVWKLDHHSNSATATPGVAGAVGGGSAATAAGSSSTAVPTVKEIIVKFEDDEDTTTGKTPHRRVPSRYVIPVPSAYFYEEQDDVDLTPPQMMVSSSSSSSNVANAPGASGGNTIASATVVGNGRN